MSLSAPTLLRRAAHLLTARVVLLQAALIVTVLVLVALWLQVPDASALDVVGSVVLGLVVIAVATGGETGLVLWVAGQPRSRRKLLLGAGMGVGVLLLWWGFRTRMEHLDANTYLYASYMNSKLPHGLRTVLSYPRMMSALHGTWATLGWVVGGALAVPVLAMLLEDRPGRAMARVFASPVWWIALVVAVVAGVDSTAALLHWVPGHALGVELFSLLLRLLCALALDALLMSAMLCLTVALLERVSPLYRAPTGTPEISQPRTMDGL